MTTKFGLDYFQIGVHFFQTRNARLLKSLFGPTGLVIYFELIADVFDNGYYLKLDDDYVATLAIQNDVDKELIEKVILKLVDLELFDRTLFNENSILSSVDIQNHYAIVKKRIPSTKNDLYPYLLIDMVPTMSKQQIAYCRRREKGKKKDAVKADNLSDPNIDNQYLNECDSNGDTNADCKNAKTKREKKRSKRKENEVKRREEKRKIKIKNNFYLERDSRSLYAHECAEEGGRESFRNKIRFLIFSLLEDKEWCRAACAFSSDPQEYEKHLKDKLQKYYDYIILVGGEKSLNDIEDYKRRFHFWQRDHDSINESDSLTEKKEKVPPATKVSKVEAARLLEQQAIEMVTQKLSENV